MTDDTNTWLKKNPTINPLRRSLKTSLRFHAPSADMDSSILSNPDKEKAQQLFIPRMLQRGNARATKFRACDFKVPEMVPPKFSAKKGDGSSSGSGLKKKVVPRTKSQIPSRQSRLPERKSTLSVFHGFPSAESLPQKPNAKKSLIQKMVELQETRKNWMSNNTSQSKPAPVVSADNSVPRSILKIKRASLRRSSGKKPIASKKVLFAAFDKSGCAEEKENDFFSMEGQFQSDFDDFSTIEDPTVFLNFPNTKELESSAVSEKNESTKMEDDEEACTPRHDVSEMMKTWKAYQENMANLDSIRNSVEESFESLIEHSLQVRDQFMEYKKDSEEIHNQLKKLGEELQNNFKSLEKKTPNCKRRSTGRRSIEKEDKIKMSDKSKAIRRVSLKRASIPKRLSMND